MLFVKLFSVLYNFFLLNQIFHLFVCPLLYPFQSQYCAMEFMHFSLLLLLCRNFSLFSLLVPWSFDDIPSLLHCALIDSHVHFDYHQIFIIPLHFDHNYSPITYSVLISLFSIVYHYFNSIPSTFLLFWIVVHYCPSHLTSFIPNMSNLFAFISCFMFTSFLSWSRISKSHVPTFILSFSFLVLFHFLLSVSYWGKHKLTSASSLCGFLIFWIPHFLCLHIPLLEIKLRGSFTCGKILYIDIYSTNFL